MPLILPGNVASATAAGYEVANSLRFDGASSAYLSKTFGSSGNRKTFTFSFWVKKCESATNPDTMADAQMLFGGQQSSYPAFQCLFLHTNDTIFIKDAQGATDIQLSIKTEMQFRDPSAWSHVVFAVDTTQSTASNRAKLYINGVQQTDLDGENATGGARDTPLYPDQNQDLQFNGNEAHYINKYATNYEDMYMAEFVFVDGSQLDATSFGEFDSDSGIWKPIDVSGLTFGTNGFYLDFEDSSSLGNDAAGSNNWTTNNIAATDQSIDTCTNNFCTLMSNTPSSANFTLSEGNLVASKSGATTVGLYGSSIMLTKGKWYYESKITDLGSGDRSRMGVAAYESVTGTSTIQGSFSGFEFTGTTSGRFSITVNGSTTEIDGFNSYAQGDIIMWAVDMDNTKLYIGKNGDWFNYSSANTGGDPTSGNGWVTNNATALAAPLTVGYVGHAAGVSDSTEVKFNFGSPAYSISSGNSDANGYGNFEYAVPSGYFAICTKNLAEYG